MGWALESRRPRLASTGGELWGVRPSLNGCPGQAGDVGEIGEEQVYAV